MELKPTPTSPKAKQNADIETLFRDKNFTELHRPGPRNSRTFIILLSIVIAIFSGFFGGMFFYYFFPNQSNQTGQVTFRSARGSELTPEKINELRDNTQRGLISFFVKKEATVSTDPRSDLYHPWEQLATGLAVTSDGWIVAPRFAFTNLSASYVGVNSEGTVFTVQKIMADPTSALYFLKIDTNNLPVVDFATSDDIFAGDEIFIVTNNGQTLPNLFSTDITQLKHFSYTSLADYIESSDQYRSRAILKDPLTANYQGAVAVNGSGKILGIVTAKEWPSNELVLGYQIQPGLASLLKRGEVVRPTLGVHYLDLSRKTNYPPTNTEGRKAGALIFGDRDTNLPAVEPGSAAEKSGLQKGDIIIKVNDLTLDEQQDLTDAVQDFSPGDTVKLKVIRSSKEITVEVTLNSQK